MNTSKHTPGLLQVASEATACILGPSKTGLRIIAIAEEPNQTENARRLVHCWNCHDDLLEALQDCLESLVRCVDDPKTSGSPAYRVTCIQQARAALAKAGKGEE